MNEHRLIGNIMISGSPYNIKDYKMNTLQQSLGMALTSSIFLFVTPAFSDQVINDDLIVTAGACVGVDCVDGEAFGFLGLKIKNDEPQILFDDTSIGAFPTNNWVVGITDNAMAGPANFIIRDVTADSAVLVLFPGATGGIALGSGSTVEANAVSVGAEGAERRIMHVADGVDDTDALNKAQLDAQIDAQFAPILAPIDERIDALEAQNAELSGQLDTRIDGLETRISGLLDRIDSL
jgi:hypothetical protein